MTRFTLLSALVTSTLCLASQIAQAAPAKVTSIVLARKYPAARGDITKTFAPGERTFHAIITLERPSTGDKVKAVWIIHDAGGVKSYRFAETTLGTKRMDTLHFAASLKRPWPRGKYRIDVYVNGKWARQAFFDVK